jgi:hypothetical protein
MCPQHEAPDVANANAPARESKAAAAAYILPIQADRLDAGMKHHDHCVSSSEQDLRKTDRS